MNQAVQQSQQMMENMPDMDELIKQMQQNDGQLVPALGYLDQVERMIRKSAVNKLTKIKGSDSNGTYLSQRKKGTHLFREQ